MKIDGSQRHHHVHAAHRSPQLATQASVADPAQVSPSLFQNDLFEGAAQQPATAPTNGAPGSASAADPLTQLIGAVLRFIEQLKAMFQQPPTPPAVGTTPPVSGTPGAGAVPGTTPGATPATAEDQFRQLIAADIKASRGTEATAADYDYWLPKLMGPNDSGFVTSGQMSATEYWHRRMLGWQAGGSDAAQFGPFAGDGQEHGPIPSADSIVPGVPSSGLEAGGVTPGGGVPTGTGLPDGLSVEQFRRLIAADVRLARGEEPNQGDYDYWLPKLMGPNDSGLVTSGQLSATEYWHRRMLGWQAGGSDAAKFGPYAGDGQEHAPVPPYAQMLAT